MVVDVWRSLWNLAGYTLFDMTCSNRRIQQSQTPNMARLNNEAKASRVILTDISYVLTFRKV